MNADPSPTAEPGRVDRALVDRFLAEEHVAIVGTSRNPKHFANAVHRHLRDGGRTIHPVHPNAGDDLPELEGDPCVASVAALPPRVRALLVMIDADSAVDVIEQFANRPAAGEGDIVWLHRGAGQGAASPEAVEACRRTGLSVVAGACPLMFAEPVGLIHRFHRFMVRRRIEPTVTAS